MTEEEKKIVVDEDWKERAQAEKEELEKKRREKEAQEEAQEEAENREMPPASFSLLVSGLATNALIALGQFPDPTAKEQKPAVNLKLAKHHIDMLTVLEEKTAGNLEKEENDMLSKLLHELRMLFVSVSKAPAAPAAEADS